MASKYIHRQLFVQAS